jgi:hypothetical protein
LAGRIGYRRRFERSQSKGITTAQILQLTFRADEVFDQYGAANN